MANVQMITSLLSDLAPTSFATEWDNVGLQVGKFNQEVTNVLLSLDVNSQVIEEAIDKNCELIISHHPMFINGLKSIHDQTSTGNEVMKAIKNDITIYSAHTNLDIAPQGLNDYLAGLLNIEIIKPLKVTDKNSYYKLVFFVPEDYFSQVRSAVLEAGAGHIGDYSHTSFAVKGTGSFKPGKKSDPFIGKKDELTEVKERRVETIVAENKINDVLRAMTKIHPYEEVAYDIYPLKHSGENFGLGRLGQLNQTMILDDYIKLVKNKLNLEQLRYTGTGNEEIKKVAICNGSGADFIRNAKYAGADLYITGDVKYHEAQMADQYGIPLIDAGHHGTEVIVKDLLNDYLKDKAFQNNYQVNFIKSEVDTNPWNYLI